MTGQFPDQFRYEGEIFDLVGIDGLGLYTPKDFGMKPFSTCTGCWRGYMMKYDCIDGELLLVGMDVNVHDDPPEINGVRPVEGTRFFKYEYVDIGLKTKFTGKLMIGKDFIQSMYVHMGFQRAIAFQTVLELEVKLGDIVSVDDLSNEMAHLREEDPNKGARPRSPERPDIEEWVSDTFSLDYESKE